MATLRKARVCTAGIFFISGLTIANWLPRIPDIKAHLGLSNLVLGVALLGPAFGAALATAVVGRIMAHTGSAFLVRVTVAVLPISLPVIGVARSAWELGAALGLYGILNGFLDVAMNAHAVTAEREFKRPILSSMHGFYSLGAAVGAVIGGLAAAERVPVETYLAWAAVGCLVFGVWLSLGLLPSHLDRDRTHADGPRDTNGRSWTPSVIVLGLLGFCAFAGEGSAGDWSAVYMRNDLRTGPGLASAAFIAFSFAMTAGRLSGDRLSAWVGPVRLTRVLAMIASVGLGVGLAINTQVSVLVGYFLFGAGVSCLVPVVFSATGNLKDVSMGRALSHTTLLCYMGLFVGPPLIGGFATVLGLRVALFLPVCLVAGFVFAAGWTKTASGGNVE